MTLKKFLAIILTLAAAAAGFWGGGVWTQRASSAEAQKAAEARAQERASLRNAAVVWADTLARKEGEAILRSFVAGIFPSILVDRYESVETSAVGFLRIPGVAGIHLFRPNGKILYSSDAKLLATGELGGNAAWALTAAELVSRPGVAPDSLDFAVPVIQGGNVLAVIWLEYRYGLIRDSDKPAELGGETSSPPASAVSAQ